MKAAIILFSSLELKVSQKQGFMFIACVLLQKLRGINFLQTDCLLDRWTLKSPPLTLRISMDLHYHKWERWERWKVCAASPFEQLLSLFHLYDVATWSYICRNISAQLWPRKVIITILLHYQSNSSLFMFIACFVSVLANDLHSNSRWREVERERVTTNKDIKRTIMNSENQPDESINKSSTRPNIFTGLFTGYLLTWCQ